MTIVVSALAAMGAISALALTRHAVTLRDRLVSREAARRPAEVERAEASFQMLLARVEEMDERLRSWQQVGVRWNSIPSAAMWTRYAAEYDQFARMFKTSTPGTAIGESVTISEPLAIGSGYVIANDETIDQPDERIAS